ncbi:MAG: cell wall-binding repeat-containing protein [Desulfosporosinus sp.]|nr:cell wall-binding repeat-containing protein [Desulfosporosinus sp.]
MRIFTSKKTLASLVIAGMALIMTPFNAFADTGVTTARLFGSDRIGTSTAVADAGWTTAITAILAPSDDADLVDALLVAPLAGKTAPILLTDSNALTPATQAELIKLGVKNVYVVGAIDQTVVDQVNAISDVTATVLSGADSIAVATAISAKLTNPTGSFIVGHSALADALSIASYAAANNYAILVANPDGSLPASETAYKGATTYIIGGPTLVADIPGATRLFGTDRFATNLAVLNALTYKYDHVYVANGTDAHLVDSLVASSLAAESGAPIVLNDTYGDGLIASTSINSKLASTAVVTALGGHTVVPDVDVAQITDGPVIPPVVVTPPVVTPPISTPVTTPSTSTDAGSQGTTSTSNSAVNTQSIVHSRITLGAETAYYLDSSGHVWAWGAGANGELGDGTTGTTLLNPTDTVNPIYGSTVPVEVSKLSNIVSIVAGGSTCYALDSGGHVWAWGDGTYGQLGNSMKGTGEGYFPNFYGSTVPVEVSKLSNIVAIVAGNLNGYALDSSDHVWAWGAAQGIPDEPMTDVPMTMASAIPIQISTLTDIVSISADAQGGEAFAYDSSGHVWAWGAFGYVTTTMMPSPSTTGAQTPGPVQLSNLKNIVAIAHEGFGDEAIFHDSSGNDFINQADQLWYALDSSGQVWSWEFIGALQARFTPVKVSNLSNIVAIAGRGVDGSLIITKSGYALDNSGHVWAWGDGANGELGNGSVTKNQSTPVLVSNISNIVKIAGNDVNCYALDSGGHVWAWGDGTYGQLGNGSLTNSNVPVQVLGLPK